MRRWEFATRFEETAGSPLLDPEMMEDIRTYD